MAQAFFGGICPSDQKAATDKKPIEPLPPPAHVVLHTGAPCVAVGELVTVGQRVGEDAVPIHASVSGRVTAVEPRVHSSGVPAMSVVIENDLQNTPCPDLRAPADPERLTAEQVLELIKSAGVADMGGAAFPTHLKMHSAMGRVDTVIIDACECEPYVTSDHRLLLERPDEVLGGVKILARFFGVDLVHIAVGNNKRNAAELLRLKIAEEKAPAVVDLLHTRYPQGAEKQLCQSITGRQAPPGALPAAIGCAVFNAATVAAIFQAVCWGRPLTDRVVTVSGSGVKEPKNLLCPIGTPIRCLLDACGGVDEKTFQILMGGPLTGQAQFDMDAPIGKGANAVLAFCKDEDRSAKHPVCIRCGRCVSVCPMRLQPVFMHQFAQAGMLRELEEARVLDCIECGSCAYICPGRLQLVQSFRTGKQKILSAKSAPQAAEGGKKEA